MMETVDLVDTAMVEDVPVKRGRNSKQLDVLLLKAESYSKFILENQQRSQKLLTSQQQMQSPIAEKKKRGKAEGSVHASSAKKQRLLSDGSSCTTPESSLSIDSSDASSEEIKNPAMKQPSNLVNGALMPHQIEGLQWLLSLWENGLNGILADEMGLGKTIQIIALIAHLREHKTAGPYLIAGPLATLGNWIKEFEKWLPSCPIILYHGTKQEREDIRRKKMPVHQQKSLDFPIVITSFELCIQDRPFLDKFTWQYIILDEGHRIKNRNCRLLRELKSLNSVSRLLLTGTPIQNSLEELWSLLNFCSPMIFDDLDVFKSWFGFKNIGSETKIEDILDEEERDRIVTKLHEILRPFVLRRMKKDVLGAQVVEKKEIVVYCGMSNVQREFYARVLDNTLRDTLIELNIPNAKNLSQINQMMNLRKVCNHPFLFGDLATAEGVSEDSPEHLQLLISSCGKFRVLDRMLPSLLARGSKMILFSQMTEVLNLIEDYFIAKGYPWHRLDGATKLIDRQDAIDEFNDPDSEIHLFLLSTRAGGLGINLTAADTVILFDSDWNPHMDSQAQSRCHRIGQTRAVTVYRFITTRSVEIDMMKAQMSKKKLERLAIEGGDFARAGTRGGGTKTRDLTLEELRRLLTDDVRRLGEVHDHMQVEAGEEEEEMKEISEYELAMILDRNRLFGPGHDRLASTALPPRPSAATPAAATSSASKKGSGSKRKAAIKQEAEPQLQVGSEDMWASVPLEGEMYDIVVDCGGAGIVDSIV